jgi:hypothetical protein
MVSWEWFPGNGFLGMVSWEWFPAWGITGFAISYSILNIPLISRLIAQAYDKGYPVR